MTQFGISGSIRTNAKQGSALLRESPLQSRLQILEPAQLTGGHRMGRCQGQSCCEGQGCCQGRGCCHSLGDCKGQGRYQGQGCCQSQCFQGQGRFQ